MDSSLMYQAVAQGTVDVISAFSTDGRIAALDLVVLEDDPRFNAGTGSRVRIDGETIQMDAAVMHSEGSFGAVAAIERVANPVRVARAVVGGPHRILAGDGATAFARALGMADYDPSTEASLARSREAMRALREASVLGS